MKVQALSLILLASAALATGCGKAGAAPSKATPTPVEAIPVTTAKAESKTLPRVLEVTGALTADETIDVAAERDGRVATVRVERGTFVEKGAILATIDDVEARASLAEAKANLSWTKSETERYTELRQKGVVAPSERQRKETDLETTQARVTLAQKALEDCVIRAPFSGLITDKRISAGAFIRRGQALAGLVKIEPLRAELAIPESAASAVKAGQTVALRVQTFPDQTFPGTIRYVGPSLRSDARTLVVEAVVPNPRRALRPGFFATAAIELPGGAPAVLAPAAAIVTESGVSRTFVVTGTTVSERLVSLGDRRGDVVEVRSGLAAGDEVVLTPDRRLADGSRITR